MTRRENPEGEPFGDPEEFGDPEGGTEAPGVLPHWLLDTPWWSISALLHLLILALLGGIVLTRKAPVAKTRDMSLMVRRHKPRPINPVTPVDVISTPPIPGKIDKNRPVKVLKPPKITPDIPKGTNRESMADTELNGNYTVDVFGAGGGAAAAFGDRTGHGRLTGGGSPGTQSAVRAALEWLKRHQNPDGSWSGRDFVKMCDKKTGPCRNSPGNKAPWGKDDGRGWKEHDIGITALAVLAFTGYGQSHQSGIYKGVLKKAVKFLTAVQIKGTGNPAYDGCFRFRSTLPRTQAEKRKEMELDEELEWIYDHAIATMAVGELLALSGDTLGLQRCVEEAAEFCLRAQTDGSGWRYSVKSEVPDTSVTGWMVLALKTVRICRLMGYVSRPTDEELRRSFAGAMKWFDLVTDLASGVTGYQSPGDQGSALLELTDLKGGYPFSKELSCMTAVSVLCRLFAGESRRSTPIRKGVGVLMRHLPRWRLRRGKAPSTINMYYWYYGTLAMFQYGGGPWREWNKAMVKALVPTQRRLGDVKGHGCEAGSWDPIGEWGLAGGRVYATAMGALTLEVYYRFRRVEETRDAL